MWVTSDLLLKREEAVIDSLYPLGQITDFGDVVRQERWLIKGRRLTVIPHYGAEVETTAADRVPGSVAVPPPPGRKPQAIMDLHADMKRALSVVVGDEFGNPTSFDGTISYVGDNPALINVTDNGDGTAVVAAVGGTGNLGTANLTYTIAPTVGDPIVRVEAVNVIAGGAETFTLVAGPEEEVTPDV